jgi:lipoyl synthase
MEARRRSPGQPLPAIHFYTPTFKSFQSSELSACGNALWPAISITGGECALQCDHCKAKVLEPMIPARTPQALWDTVVDFVARGAKGMLLSGGSNRRNEVGYGPFLPTIRRIKDRFPDFGIAVHTALVGEDTALGMEQAGIDVAMMDVIGAQETITQVYHLKRHVEDFEHALEALVATRMKVVPHIVLGLHYGRLLGEWRALEMVQRHLPDALVLVVVMPFYAPPRRPFAVPDGPEVGRFFMDAREALPDIPLLLGCARPPGRVKAQIDSYAVLAGLDGIAHPADGVVELAARLGRPVRVRASCCSLAVAEGMLPLDRQDSGIELDLRAILDQERRIRESTGFGRLSRIPVVAQAAGAAR